MSLKGILKSILGKPSKKSNPLQPPIASSSSSSLPTRHYSYDVFPSFSGQDVRRTFLSHFLEGLKTNGTKTFIDNGIMRSESINSELIRAIKESRIAVVILSKNYSSSSWCLNELQLIMECRDTLGQTVMPIFCDVDPSDVRKQTGDFGKAFEETCYGKTEEQKERWTKALNQVAVIAGEHSVSWASEAEMISKIVMDVSNELPSTDFDRLVGIEAHVKEMKSVLCLTSDEVKIVGIWGPAGIGKTTIARALYDQVSSNFQLKFYKENLEGKKKVLIHGTIRLKHYLQKELLSGVLDYREMKIPDLQEAQFRLKHQRVLLVLDDLLPEELQALGDIIKGLRFGSKVNVISEDIDTLRECGVNENQTYRVAFPSSEKAMQIFSYSALGQSSPPRGYLEHAVEVTKLVTPIPLGLKVLGSSLRGKSKDEWIMTLSTLRTCLDDDKHIWKVIRFSYEKLSYKHKYILYELESRIDLDKNVNNAIFFLAERDWDVEKGIQTLADMALISKLGDGRIIMHYLVQYYAKKFTWSG
ncbi:PREDICTED: probable disease resistance protein RPP1 [Camelina sativa]|uniref:Probable disease resistance protein RPP1 n=1 Tax=Camelina sativa TaxID=90675 RepID=A0ABM0VC67_CAMSA|nr:PREDICTED: probable disease resistance protein RPP1 [Camelina sativa]